MRDPDLRPADKLSELERGLIDAARQDRIPSELRAHMARALGQASVTSQPAADSGSAPAAGGAPATGAAPLFVKTVLWGSLAVMLGAAGYATFWQSRALPMSQERAHMAARKAAPAPADEPEVRRVQDTAPDIVQRAHSLAVTPHSAAATPPARARAAKGSAQPAALTIDTLQAELALLDRARAALKSGEPERALALLDRHTEQFAQGALVPEAEALRIDSWLKSGEHARAGRAARRFLQSYPDHPLAVRVARAAASH